MQLSTLPGSEKLSLLIRPKVEGSALAPLEEAPPSWLQPARPLCAPAALLMPPTRYLFWRRHPHLVGRPLQSSRTERASPRHGNRC